jgi:hypothetical protein
VSSTTRRFVLGGSVIGGLALTASPSHGVEATTASYVPVGQLLAGDLLVGLDGGVRRVVSVSEEADGFHVACSSPDGPVALTPEGGGGFVAGREFLVLERGVPVEVLAPAVSAPLVIDGGRP